MRASLLIRADASTRMGTGHVMRCLALAQVWQDQGGRVVFAQADSTPAVRQRLAAEGMEVRQLTFPAGSEADAFATVSSAKELGAEWVVLDGYHFTARFQEQIKQAGLRLLVLDDLGQAEFYHADLVLNQNLHADAALYPRRAAHTRLLLGTQFVLLRREFLRGRGVERAHPALARKVLVTLGGSDPDNQTARVIEGLRGLDVEVKVVAGGSNPHLESLSAATRVAGGRFELIVNATDMPSLMSWADLAVCSGGSTVWELAFMGVPAVVGMISPAEERLVSGLARLDLFVRPGWFRDLDPGRIAAAVAALLPDAPLRSVMARRGRAVIDGLGGDRVLSNVRGPGSTST